MKFMEPQGPRLRRTMTRNFCARGRPGAKSVGTANSPFPVNMDSNSTACMEMDYALAAPKARLQNRNNCAGGQAILPLN